MSHKIIKPEGIELIEYLNNGYAICNRCGAVLFLLRKNHSSFYGKLIKSERGLRVMDEMKISSKFTRMLLSKLAKGVLHKKLGYNVDIQLNELNASISDEKAHVHVSIDADMSKEELMIILKKIGLN